MAVAPKILGTDTLRNAYPKFNQAIDLVNETNTLVVDGDLIKGIKSTNLFNKDTATDGYYINTSGNLIANVSFYVSDFIRISPSTQYSATKADFIAYYDGSKNFISTSSAVVSPFTTLSSASYLKISTNINKSTLMLNQGAVLKPYESYYLPKLDINTLRDPIPASKLDKNVMVGMPSKNLFNISTVTDGKYVNYANGALNTNATRSASDFIEVEASTQYALSGTTEQLAFFDNNKVYISGIAVPSTSLTTPANAKYIRLSMFTTEKGNVQFEKGANKTSYESYGIKLESNFVKGLSTVREITVKKDGTGDFTSVVAAVNSIKDSSKNKIYNVVLYDAEYDIIAELGGNTWLATITESSSEREGLQLPDYVNLKGAIDKVHLKGYIDDSVATSTITSRVSTVNCWMNNDFENLKFTGYNMRYAIHDETNNAFSDYTRRMKNCDIIYLGKATGMSAPGNGNGGGAGSGGKYYYENCYFESPFIPYALHDNSNFKKGLHVEFNNCEFKSLGTYALRFGSHGTTNQHHDVLLNNCMFGGKLLQFEEVTNSGIGHNFYIKGGGNTPTPYVLTDSTNDPNYFEFSDEVGVFKNYDGAVLTKGTPVRLIGTSVSKLITTDGYYLFYGVVLKDIPVGGYGKVKFKGYLRKQDTNLATIAVGDRIGIVNGELAVVTNNDFVAIATGSNDLLLR
jgi:hypothetical protein